MDEKKTQEATTKITNETNYRTFLCRRRPPLNLCGPAGNWRNLTFRPGKGREPPIEKVILKSLPNSSSIVGDFLRHHTLLRSCHVNRHLESRKIRMPSRSRLHFRRTHPCTSTRMVSLVALPLQACLPRVQRYPSSSQEQVYLPATITTAATTMSYSIVHPDRIPR